ncbi:MAG: ABC transporter permease, partial [Thermoleophilia bacterium]|nr:ABC transporter permease [Thermoleophilia bacterium]
MTEDLNPTEHMSSADAARATAELNELAGHFDERMNEAQAAIGGDVHGAQRSLLGDAVRRFSHNRIAMLGAIIIMMFTILAIFVPLKGAWNPLYSSQPAKYADYGGEVNKPYSFRHPLGTDDAGRDLWKRSWVSARISLSIALAVALVILIIGVLYGATAGYLGGRIDNIMMRFLDSLYGLPYLPFAIITVTLVRSHWPDAHPLLYMVPALTITTWFGQARMMRSQVLSLKQNEYVESARSQGASTFRTVFRHILPNTIGITVVSIALEVPGAILGEAFLSYLALGVQPPASSWGLMA